MNNMMLKKTLASRPKLVHINRIKHQREVPSEYYRGYLAKESDNEDDDQTEESPAKQPQWRVKPKENNQRRGGITESPGVQHEDQPNATDYEEEEDYGYGY